MLDGSEVPEIRPGSKIGRFVVEGELGAGGMGVVYAARDRELDRRVALKVLRARTADDEAQRLRLLREGQAMARVTHPNVITVHEVGIEGRLVFLAQELLDGGTLGSWLTKPRTVPEIVNMFVAAGRGLAAAHAAGLVHRDFKPDNVLLGKDGRVRVADFGLARALALPGEPAYETRVDALGETAAMQNPMAPLTRTGAVMGTPLYMAPEQHEGHPADARSDQFSFCVALYHGLYGEPPFAGKTTVALADAVLNGRIEPPPKGKAVPARLRKILLRGLAVNPADRYPSMDALLAELARQPARTLRRGLVIAGLAAVIAGAVVGGYALRSRTGETEIAGRRTVAVMGFKNLSGDRTTEWVSSALSELLATELASDEVRVTPAEDAHRARVDLQLPPTESFSPETLGKLQSRLGADAIVVGSYLASDSELTLLVVVEDVARHRTKRIELRGSAAALPALVAQAGPKIKDALGIKAVPKPAANAVLPRNADAARSYIEGVEALRVYNFRAAKQALLASTKREPDFAPAHLALAQAYEGLFDGDAAQASAKRALETAKSLPIDQQLLVTAQAYERLGQPDQAREPYRRLLAMAPDNVDAALALVRLQPPDEAAATIAALRKLPPPAGSDPRIDAAEAELELARANPTRAVELAKRATQTARTRGASIVLAGTRETEGRALAAAGELAASADAYEEARKLYDTAGDRLAVIRVVQQLGALAFDRGLYDDAYDRYDAAAALLRQAGHKEPATVAAAAAAVALALRGKLADADAKLRDLDAKGLAAAYADLGAGVIAWAKGDAATALARSQKCAYGFATSAPAFAALCWQLRGDVQSDQGEPAAARKAYEEGLAIATKTASPARAAALELALAQLDLDEGHDEPAVQKATTVQQGAASRGAVALEAHARIVLARALLAQASSQKALETLEGIDLATLQPFRIKIQYGIALGEAHAALGDPESSAEKIEAARAEADKRNWTTLVLEARLAKVQLLVQQKSDQADAELQALLRDARAKNAGRIVRLAEAITVPHD
ncbi:MAG TPA: protein kinase [Kofleriaceae bacterium]|nr:protein kinase [Kofleriaceae bacterium]